MSSLAVGSITGPNRSAAGATVSSWIQKRATHIGLLSSPMLAIGLSLAGLLPLFLS